MLRIDENRLKAAIARAGFDSYEAVERAARERGLGITSRTLFNILRGSGWRQSTIVELCNLLNCQPSDIMTIDDPAAVGSGIPKEMAPTV